MPAPSQLKGWSPFKSSGGEPPHPPAIGRAPRGPNARFPGVEAPTQVKPPPGGYQSIISANPPLDEGRKRQFMRTPAPMAAEGQRPQSAAAGASLSAFGRALTDNTRSSLGSAAAKYQQEFVNQAQKSQAEDIHSQRQNAMDLYRMLTSNAVAAADMFTGYDQGSKNTMQKYWTERWNEEAERTAMWLRFIGSMF